MDVTKYTFQSPSTNQVQVGKPVPSTQKTDTTGQSGAEFTAGTNTSLENAKNFVATQTEEVKPSVDSSQILDIYA